MPAATLSRRTLPATLADAIAAYTGNVTRHDTGARRYAPAITNAAERGATPDDIRAADCGLITLATPARDKRRSARK